MTRVKKAREYRRERRVAGLCKDCSNPAAPRRLYCQECLAKSRAYCGARYAARKEAGLCVLCGKSAPEEGRVYCVPCTLYMREANRASRQKKKRRSRRGGKARRPKESGAVCAVRGEGDGRVAVQEAPD